ncbi:hypothetical protein BDR06DRAFT_985720 [Suillus hirtellus]|nr:hypothetical protein BDR06DRAFT_985720 [Suillus hirtellus]
MDSQISQKLNNVLQCLEVNRMTISDFIEQLLQGTDQIHESAKNNLVQQGSEICTHLYQYSDTHTSISLWANEVRDLGEIGGDNGVDESMSDTSNEQRNNSRKHWTHVQVEARNTALQIIKTIVCTSIILQNSNERCNYLQGLLGIFFHLTCVPQKVIDVLAHVGLSISITSIHNAVDSMSKEIAANIKQGINNPEALHCSAALWAADSHNPTLPKQGKCLSPQLAAFAWHVRDILVQHGQYFGSFADKLGEPESVLWIPFTKTDQILFHSMRIKQSTADGNMELMENLLRQGGIRDPIDKEFTSAGDVDMSEHVLLIHSDLLTKEWLDTIRNTQRIESTPKN